MALGLGIALSTTKSEAQPPRRARRAVRISEEVGDGAGVPASLLVGPTRPPVPLVVAGANEGLVQAQVMAA